MNGPKRLVRTGAAGMTVVVALAVAGCGGDGAADVGRSAEQTETVVVAEATAGVPLDAPNSAPPAGEAVAEGGAQRPTGPASGGAMTPVEVVEQVRPAVVTVINGRVGGALGSGEALEAGRGTGFIIDEAGHVVTNQHVVASGDAFAVILADGETRAATLVGADPLSDLAVVRIEGPVPATVELGDSDALQVAQPVLAIGSPLASFTNTVTDGIVSALNRDLPGQAGQGEPSYNNLIQHNAAINPGNSGGPLFDLSGRVIGVNTLGISGSAGVPAQGLFFAIPATTVRGITAQLIEQGRVLYPALGASVTPITAELVSQYGLPVDHGVLVRQVAPNGPAARAGIREGDFVLALDGQRIDEENTYTEVLFAHRPGETLPVRVQRGGEQLELEVTLRERPPR